MVGFFLFVMSKMWSPSKPGGTGFPSHDEPAAGVFEFHERLRMLP
jgi:hypothetical protein